MDNSGEKWEPLGAKEPVFEVGHPDGKVVVAGTRAGGMFGALVRKRQGAWQKRVEPLVILNGAVIQHMAGAKKFQTLANLS